MVDWQWIEEEEDEEEEGISWRLIAHSSTLSDSLGLSICLIFQGAQTEERQLPHRLPSGQIVSWPLPIH